MNKNIQNILSSLSDKRKKLHNYRSLDKGFIKNLWDWLRVELTYTSKFHSVERSLDLYLQQIEGTEQEQVLLKEWERMRKDENRRDSKENQAVTEYKKI